MNQTIESQRYQEPNEEEEGQFGIFDEEVSLNWLSWVYEKKVRLVLIIGHEQLHGKINFKE